MGSVGGGEHPGKRVPLTPDCTCRSLALETTRKSFAYELKCANSALLLEGGREAKAGVLLANPQS